MAMHDLIARIRSRVDDLNRSERKVADVILQDPNAAIGMSIATLAQAATVSEESWHFDDPQGQALFEAWKRADAQFDLDRGNRAVSGPGVCPYGAQVWRLSEPGVGRYGN